MLLNIVIMTVDILSINGGTTGRSATLPAEVFEQEPNEHAVYLDVKRYLAAQRQGTHKAKERGEVAGSRRKLKRQKGTGTARAGDIKSPIFRGGGRVFGPRSDRNYTQKINKKVKQLARRSALSVKAAEGNVVVIEDFSFDAPKAKAYADIIRALELDTKKTLVVTSDYEKEVYLSSRSMKKSSVMRAQDLSTYDILNAQTVILAEGAVDKIKETLS